MIRVLVVDDHAVVRRGVRHILAEADDMLVAGEATSGGEALKAVQEQEYDVVLLDIALPDINGLEVLRQFRDRDPGLRVIMLSMYPKEQYAEIALKDGAAGYVNKESVPDELIAAIREVWSGGTFVT
ncbi:MAG: response regulator transcription factor [Anaerolineales bacterium]